MTGRTRRLLRGGLVALLVLALAGVVGVVVAFPAVAATTCPGCYGMVQLRPGVHVEPGLSSAEEQHVLEVVDSAERQVDGFFGGLASSPSFLACRTDACYSRIGGGGERGVAVLNRAVMLSPRGLDPVIATHELTHVELHTRLGGAAVPQWFDEGLAVLVSGDDRYLRADGDRCRVEPAGPLPSTLPEWLRAASADPQVYAQAACRVSRWAATNDVRALVAGLADGAPFPDIP
ncbi:hypothetical protein [Pseudonocardia sp. TRM90224]|uniref:hypothetical protein n=1 Tax=Pseudonocardia sp. TRM90224 TaxID=2812678 RepID=UPI001E442C8F|nr:hypothetical protein [Pseudonocardia sp. TRM90224]